MNPATSAFSAAPQADPKKPWTASVGMATGALLGVTFVWGAGFLVVKDTVAAMPVVPFLAWRFVIATVVMVAARPQVLRRLDRAGWRHGVVLGLVLASGYLAQTFGLEHTSASVSGFITGMFVVFTPLIAGVFLHQPVGRSAWFAVGVATVGLGLLSLTGFHLGAGDGLTLLCALSYAMHIVGLGRWSARHNSYALAVVQLATVSVVCLAWTASSHAGLPTPPNALCWLSVIGNALLATAAAFVVQTWAQTLMTPTRAAVVLTMEPVFAGLVGVVIGGDQLAARGYVGAALVVAAMYLVELGPRRGAEARVERLE